MQLYVRIRGRVYGPFEEAKLLDMVQRGQLSRVHQVSTDGQVWKKASEFPELFDAAKSMVFEPAPSAIAPISSNPMANAIAAAAPPVERVSAAPPIPTEWYYSDGSVSLGPISFQELKRLCDNGYLTRESLIWRADFPSWKPAGQISGLFAAYSPMPAAPRSYEPSPAAMVTGGDRFAVDRIESKSDKSRVVYILLALFLGGFGIHNFYAGYGGKGVAQLLVTLFLGAFLVPLVAVGIWIIIDMCTVTHDAQGRRFS